MVSSGAKEKVDKMVSLAAKEKVDKLYAAVTSTTVDLYPKENPSMNELRVVQADKEQWPNCGHENDHKTKYGGKNPRDMLGYGPSPKVKWPNKAKVALSIVINYEEGGENCVLHGDEASEALLSDIPGAKPYEGQRNMNMESMYEYGSRAGFWRLHRLFTKRNIPVTVFAVGMALERNPAVCHALQQQKDWEVASHGYRWIDYQNVDEDTEREHIQRSIQIHEKLLGKRPVGIYQGKPNENSRKLIVEDGGFKYDSDSYADDLPYWNMEHEGKLHLIIPYSLTENDMRFCSTQGSYSSGEAFARDLKETLRYLVEEGRAGHCRMMSVGLHCRLARPGRVAAIAEFLDFVKSYGRDVWVCTREEIADFWIENHYPKGAGTPMKHKLDTEIKGELLVDFKKPSSSPQGFGSGTGGSSYGGGGWDGSVTTSENEDFGHDSKATSHTVEEEDGDII